MPAQSVPLWPAARPMCPPHTPSSGFFAVLCFCGCAPARAHVVAALWERLLTRAVAQGRGRQVPEPCLKLPSAIDRRRPPDCARRKYCDLRGGRLLRHSGGLRCARVCANTCIFEQVGSMPCSTDARATQLVNPRVPRAGRQRSCSSAAVDARLRVALHLHTP